MVVASSGQFFLLGNWMVCHHWKRKTRNRLLLLLFSFLFFFLRNNLKVTGKAMNFELRQLGDLKVGYGVLALTFQFSSCHTLPLILLFMA